MRVYQVYDTHHAEYPFEVVFSSYELAKKAGQDERNKLRSIIIYEMEVIEEEGFVFE